MQQLIGLRGADMTSKERAAMQQALEALESKLGETHPFAHDLEKAAAIRTLREALAEQAEQEPVLYPVRRGSRITCIESGEKCVVWATSHTDCWVQFPDGQAGKYTYEQIGKYFSIEENQAADEAYDRGSKEGIEAGKKTEQAEQEPVGWTAASNIVNDGYGHSFSVVSSEPANTTEEPYVPLYAAPVRTKDLTDDEIEAIECSENRIDYELFDEGEYGFEVNIYAKDFARAVIAADREKNK